MNLSLRYVWIDSDYWDGHSFDLCCKTLTLPDAPVSLDDIPIWTYSGDVAWLNLIVSEFDPRILVDQYH